MAKNIVLELVDIKTVIENGERTERERARATAETLIAESEGAPRVNRLVSALAAFGVDEANARSAIRDLIGDGRVAVREGLIHAS